MQQRGPSAAAAFSSSPAVTINIPQPQRPLLRKPGASRWETIIIGLVLLLVATCAGAIITFVYIYKSASSNHRHHYSHSHKKNVGATSQHETFPPESPEEAALRLERMNRVMQHLDHNGNDNEAKKPVVAAAGGEIGVDGGKVQRLKPRGLLVDAVNNALIKDLSDAQHHTAWKVSCVGKKRKYEDGDAGSSATPAQNNNNHHADDVQKSSSSRMKSDGASCFMNLELVDARDEEQKGQPQAAEPQHLSSFATHIGNGIRRPHRAIPDDCLVPLYLDPKPVRIEAVDNATLVTAGGNGQHHMIVEQHRLRHQAVAQSFRWISPTHHGVTVAVHSSLSEQEADAPPHTRTTFSFHGAHGNAQSKSGARFFGVGNRGASMELPFGRDVNLKNLDLNHYPLDPTISLYGTVPLVYAALRVDRPGSGNSDGNQKKKDGDGETSNNRKDTLFIGILFLNGSPMQLRAMESDGEGGTPSLSFAAAGGGMRILFLPGPTPMQVLKQYHQLTGAQAFVPLWSLGYHQCRWTYKDQSDILDTVHQGFLKHNMPADALWLDIGHTDDMRYFTWDRNNFPNPVQMQRQLFREGGRRLVAINDPHIKKDPGYYVYAQAQSAGYFVTGGVGTDSEFNGHCWSGNSAWIDFLRPDVRAWYSTLFRYSAYRGSTPHLFLWQDMNEPSVFSGPDLTLPLNGAAHFGGTVVHRDVHNLYGFYMTMAGYAGLRDRDLPENGGANVADAAAGDSGGIAGLRRPFILTRSFFAGSHRFASVWTGDNQGKWQHLEKSFEMVLMLAMSGIQHSGADIGGFFDSVTSALLSAWYAAGVAYPFFRGHAHQDVPRREPWLDRQSKPAAARALQTRYRIIPHLYSLFSRSFFYGDAVLNPLFFSHPELVFSANQKAFDAANSAEFFFWGSALLFRPFVRESEINDAAEGRVSVDVCAAAPYLWSDGGRGVVSAVAEAPIFVNLCTMEWVSPSADGGRSCRIMASECETPMFQRSSTIVVFNALTPSLAFNSGFFREEFSLRADKQKHLDALFAAGITQSFPRSTADTLTAHSPIEVRVAFLLESDGRDGDVLAHGTHFIDDGESDINEEMTTAKMCLMTYSLHQVGTDGLSLCAGPAPEERRDHSDLVINSVPFSQPSTCFDQLQRIQRFVFSVHVEGGAENNKNPALKVAVARPKSAHGGVDDGGKEEAERSSKLIKSESGTNGETWVVPWSRDRFERLAAVNAQWCLEMRPL